MAEDLLKVISTQATLVLGEHVRKELNLVVNVEGEIQTLVTTLGSIQAKVRDAEKREIQLHGIKGWLQNLKFASYEADDALTDWSIAICEVNGNTSRRNLRKKACLAILLPCVYSNQIAPLRNVAKKIQRINRTLASIDTAKNAFEFDSTHPNPPIDEEAVLIAPQLENEATSFGDGIIGREDDKDTLLSQLTNESTPPIIFIWGMSGIGKTTLARSLFKHFDNHFDIQMWVSVGRTFDAKRVAKAIVEELSTMLDCSTLQSALRHVCDLVKANKFLLVLDNVWEWEEDNGWKQIFAALKGGAMGSKILITSQNEGVGENINAIVTRVKMFSQQNEIQSTTFMHHLEALPIEDIWTIFSKLAFSGRSHEFCEDLKATGWEICGNCDGLPLAAETVGKLMQSRKTRDEWTQVLDDRIWQLELNNRLPRALLLSYYDLPPAIKRCFCYCANFPKDSQIDAVNLIQIWMAQGYLGSYEMEITGQTYLNTLVMRSLFQETQRDKDSGAIIRFKLHNMVHNVADYMLGNECSMVSGTPTQVDQNQDLRPWMQPRHMTIIDARFPIRLEKSERLYTFSVQSFHDCPQTISQDCVRLPPKFFDPFKYLKTLDMSRNMLLALPDDIQNLKNLRYLNLSHNPLFNLPESVCSLQNLQTLKLVGCRHLTELPKSIGKLQKLRHLEFDQATSLVKLPKQIGELTSLRTLSKFLVDTEDGSCKLSDLKHLNHLRGRLEIEGLNLGDENEAQAAELERKEHLADLHINCSSATGVIDALRLNTNLITLRIDTYGGHQFPRWMDSLMNLKKLRLQKWGNCISLPPLGKLPSLKILHVEGLDALTHVGSEFLGLETGAAFLKLEKLKFSHMEKWEEWDVRIDMKIMPCLRYLKLSHCDRLQSLPLDVVRWSLKKLRIRRCVILKQRYNKETGQDREMVSLISDVRIH